MLDSATLMNKVFEVIEAKNIDPSSYIGPKAIVEKGAKIGKGVKVYGGVFIGRDSSNRARFPVDALMQELNFENKTLTDFFRNNNLIFVIILK